MPVPISSADEPETLTAVTATTRAAGTPAGVLRCAEPAAGRRVTAGPRATGLPMATRPSTSLHRLGPAAHHADSALRLRILRRTGMAAALRGRQDPILVGLYAQVSDDETPHDRLADAQARAARSHWCVRLRTCDPRTVAAPCDRQQLGRLFAAVAHGTIHGIVVADRSDICTDDGAYERALRHLHLRGAFLALARDEVTP